jgi:two-component system LytT family response regulator
MKMRALIVDDEPLAREGVAIALREAKGVEIIGSCADGQSAVRTIRDLGPDLVFLDIKMPGLDGFGVIEAVGVDRMPAVVFLTAYEEHALRAFRVNAIDYLLKPIDADELRDALDRARRRIAHNDVLSWGEQLRGLLGSRTAAGHEGSDPRDRIVVRTGGRVQVLDPVEIVWVEASGDYVTIHTADKSHLVRDSISGMEGRLSAHGLQRIHRSSLVQLSAVRELVANDNGDGVVVLNDGTELKFSRTYRNALYASFGTAP